MGEPSAPDGDVVRVPTEQVDGVIDLKDVVDRVRDRAVARATQAGDRAGTPAERDAERDALHRVSELAAQLSDALGRLGPLDE